MIRSFSGFAVAGLLLAGCGTPTRVIPVEGRYVPPVATAATAFIHGTRIYDLLLGETVAYVRAVDNLNVVDPRINWDRPLALQAGPHNVTVVLNQKGYHVVQTLPLNAGPGEHYEIRFEGKKELLTGQGYSLLWIADQTTGQPVTEVVSSKSVGETIPVVVPLPLPH